MISWYQYIYIHIVYLITMNICSSIQWSPNIPPVARLTRWRLRSRHGHHRGAPPLSPMAAVIVQTCRGSWNGAFLSRGSLWDPQSSPSGWWLSPTPLKNHGVKVSWDYDIPKIWKNNSHVPNHQPAMVVSISHGLGCGGPPWQNGHLQRNLLKTHLDGVSSLAWAEQAKDGHCPSLFWWNVIKRHQTTGI